MIRPETVTHAHRFLSQQRRNGDNPRLLPHLWNLPRTLHRCTFPDHCLSFRELFVSASVWLAITLRLPTLLLHILPDDLHPE